MQLKERRFKIDWLKDFIVGFLSMGYFELANSYLGKKYGRKKKSQSKSSRDESDEMTPSIVERLQDRLLRDNGKQSVDVAQASQLEEVDLSLIDISNSPHDSSSTGESSLDSTTSRSLDLSK